MILDVSVTVKWLITERWTDQARSLLLERSDLSAPDLVDLEAASVLTRKARQRIIDDDEAIRLRLVHETMLMERFAWRCFETDAFEMSLRLYAGYYDCVYLAAAFFRDDVLVTADSRFLNATRTDPVYRRYVRSLEEI